jgi:hypothetical protein
LRDIDQRSLLEPMIIPKDLISHNLEAALHSHAKENTSSRQPPNRNVATIIFSSQQDAWQVRGAIMDVCADNSKTVFSYINIEPIDYDDVCLDIAYHNSIVILYNYAVAHCCLAQQVESDASQYLCARALRQASFQIFYVIDVYVRRRLTSPCLVQDNDILLLSALFTRTMSRLADDFNCTTINYYYNVAFETILSWIDVLHKLLPRHNTLAAAA